jgi:CSLREA domain-containing protein
MTMAAVCTLARFLPLALLLLVLALYPAPARAAEFTVNVFTDGHDFAPGNGVCSINPPLEPVVCTLRAALEEVNALAAASGGDHRINVPAGTYTVNLGVVPTRPGQSST